VVGTAAVAVAVAEVVAAVAVAEVVAAGEPEQEDVYRFMYIRLR
jgi:hypothetical protein